MFGNLTFETFSLNAVLEHADLVLVESLDGVHHLLLLRLLSLLTDGVLLLLFQQLVLLQLTG